MKEKRKKKKKEKRKRKKKKREGMELCMECLEFVCGMYELL